MEPDRRASHDPKRTRTKCRCYPSQEECSSSRPDEPTTRVEPSDSRRLCNATVSLLTQREHHPRRQECSNPKRAEEEEEEEEQASTRVEVAS